MSKQTIKEFLLENYEIATIKDINQHGCVSGCVNGLIYYDETGDFHDKHEDEIWDLLIECASEQDLTPLELIAQLNGQEKVASMYEFKNLLCWYAVEWFAHEIVNELEGNE